MPALKNPMQPFVIDEHGTVRFKENAIVRFLLGEATAGRQCDLNRLAAMGFSNDDFTQLAQLIGYSLKGFHELSYVTDKIAKAATKRARNQLKDNTIGACRDDGCEIHCGMGETTDTDNFTKPKKPPAKEQKANELGE